MADNFYVQLEGAREVQRALQGAPEKIRVRALRRALSLAARLIRDDAKKRAPRLKTRYGKMPKYRKPGTVQRAIVVRPSKFARRAGDEGVFVGVRPLRGRVQIKRYGKASARNPNDPFYWRFLEFGTRKMDKRPFLGPAARAKGNAAIQLFMREVVPAIEKLYPKGT